MKRGSTLFLKLAIILLGLPIVAACAIILPAAIQDDHTGYYRLILIGLYVPAEPFFIGLYQAIRLLGFIEANRIFADVSVRALKNIKYCALVISGLFALGMPYIYYAAERDDAPGVVAIGFVIIFASLVVAAAASLFQRLLQNAIDLKSENDLTV